MGQSLDGPSFRLSSKLCLCITILFLVMCIYVSVGVCTEMQCPQRSDVWELELQCTYDCWDLNSGPLEGWCELSITDSSLHLWVWRSFIDIIYMIINEFLIVHTGRKQIQRKMLLPLLLPLLQFLQLLDSVRVAGVTLPGSLVYCGIKQRNSYRVLLEVGAFALLAPDRSG
jgi:hypothetical protein